MSNQIQIPQPQKLKSKTVYLIIFFVALIFIIALIIFVIFVWRNKANKTEQQKKAMETELLKEELTNIQTRLNEEVELTSPSPTASPIVTPTASPITSPQASNYQFKLDYVKNPDENFDFSKLSEEEMKWIYDKKLTQVDKKTGKEKVLVDSIKKAVPELQGQFNLTLSELSFPDNPTKLYFTTILMQTDSPPFGIYAYNIIDKSFKKMGISNDFSGWIYLVTKDQKKIVVPSLFADYGSVRELLLLDLENDQKKILVTLPKNETLDENADAMGPTIQLKWIDDVTVEYDVYDQSKVTKEMIDQMGKKPKIATRQISIE